MPRVLEGRYYKKSTISSGNVTEEIDQLFSFNFKLAGDAQ